MLAACIIDAQCILWHASSSTIAPVVLDQRAPLGPLASIIRTGRPRLMLGPIMDAPSALIAINKADARKCINQSAIVVLPIASKLYVLVRHPCQIAIRAVHPCPQEQANERPRTSGAEPSE